MCIKRESNSPRACAICGAAHKPGGVPISKTNVKGYVRGFDVKTGKLLADQTVVVEGGKIVQVGAASEVKAAADAVRIDLPNATLLPLTWPRK